MSIFFAFALHILTFAVDTIRNIVLYLPYGHFVFVNYHDFEIITRVERSYEVAFFL